MAKVKTILVPVDFEPASDRALALAREIGEPVGAKIVLVHVCDTLPYVYPDMPPAFVAETAAAMRQAAEKSLAEYAAKNGGPDAILREGKAWSGLLDAIDELSPWLVVMGTHGRRGVKRLVLGSVAERVVRESKVPVVTVHPGD